MLRRLGLRRCAYDWREEHVATFAAEIDAYREHGVEFFAFWDQHPEAFRLFQEHGLKPQVWMTCPGPETDGQEAKVRAAADALEPAAARAAAIGSAFGLYNHGGWGGEPENLVAVCQELRRRGHPGTGIVYNLHHAHHRAATFAADLQLLKPYLLCLNLNGTNPDGQPKILTFGQGSSDSEILAALVGSGYQGPVGVIDHQPDTDSEPTLKANLDGLERLLGELRGGGERGR
jgi:sugar phosphate isomerase/epimerase